MIHLNEPETIQKRTMSFKLADLYISFCMDCDLNRGKKFPLFQYLFTYYKKCKEQHVIKYKWYANIVSLFTFRMILNLFSLMY